MNKFFKYPIAEEEACGGFSLGHIVFLIFCIFLIIIGVILSVKYIKDMNKFLLLIGVIALLFEIIKIIWGVWVNRYEILVEYLPLWFCSLFVPASIIAAISKGKVRKLAISFMFYGGIVGGLAYLFFPTTSLYQYPALHFLSFHSMLYHTMMVYTGIVVMIKGLIVPNISDFLWYFIFTTAFCIISYIINKIYDTNFMFLNHTSNNGILKLLEKITKSFYPLALTLIQNIGTFFISLGIFKLGKSLYHKIKQ